MSFTAEVKDEVSKLENMDAENISELSGFLSLFCEGDVIRVVTESGGVARRVYSLLSDLFSVHPVVSLKKGYNYSKKVLYSLEVYESVFDILKSLGITDVVADFIIADEGEKKAFLRGVFMACGSVNDPKKSRYHLEFNLKNYKYACFVSDILNEFNLNSKVLHRDKYMVYIKEAEKIGDFLRIIGANKAVLYYEDIRIYRDHKNMINRLNNCEQANVDRMVMSANNLIKDIEFIRETCGLELLGEREMEAAIYRVKYPDASILELSEIISLETGNKITKSGLYHRLNRIKKFASKLREV